MEKLGSVEEPNYEQQLANLTTWEEEHRDLLIKPDYQEIRSAMEKYRGLLNPTANPVDLDEAKIGFETLANHLRALESTNETKANQIREDLGTLEESAVAKGVIDINSSGMITKSENLDTIKHGTVRETLTSIANLLDNALTAPADAYDARDLLSKIEVILLDVQDFIEKARA